MKKTRQILALVFALVMIFTVVAVPASASDISQNDDAAVETVESRRAPVCWCGGTIFTSYTSWSVWRVQSTAPCYHYPYGEDFLMVRQRTVTERCNSCGQGTSYQEYDYTTECHGYNA